MRYIGSKLKLLEYIKIEIDKYCDVNDGAIFCDLFAGTGVVRDYLIKKFENEFSEFLKIRYNKNESSIKTILNNIVNINPYLDKIHTSYNDFRLFDDILIFTNNSKLVIEKINNNYNLSIKNKEIAKKTINYF